MLKTAVSKHGNLSVRSGAWHDAVAQSKGRFGGD